MDVINIVAGWLKEHGYDGLHDNGDDGCGCAVDVVLAWCCEGAFKGCSPGYRTRCDCGDHDFHIVPERPEPTETRPNGVRIFDLGAGAWLAEAPDGQRFRPDGSSTIDSMRVFADAWSNREVDEVADEHAAAVSGACPAGCDGGYVGREVDGDGNRTGKCGVCHGTGDLPAEGKSP